MRADTLGSWCARFAAVSALGAAAVAFAAGPASAQTGGVGQEATHLDSSSATILETEWGGLPPEADLSVRLLETEWG